eukprot:3386733-Pyramimonas_sp.AAC.1
MPAVRVGVAEHGHQHAGEYDGVLHASCQPSGCSAGTSFGKRDQAAHDGARCGLSRRAGATTSGGVGCMGAEGRRDGHRGALQGADGEGG